MSNSVSLELLDQARSARAEGERARRLGNQQPDEDLRSAMSRYANDMEAKAVALEHQAFNFTPGVQKHSTPQQMQQAQATPAKSDDDDQAPANSN